MAKLKVQGQYITELNVKHNLISFSQATAAETYGIEGNSMNNLIKVNIYYTSLNEKTTEDVIAYNFEVRMRNKTFSDINKTQDGSFFNALGGCLSLWLGISFCSLFEILELVFDLIGNFINRVAQKAIGRANNPL